TMSFNAGTHTGTFTTSTLTGPSSDLTVTNITFVGWTCNSTISTNNTFTITVDPAPTVNAGVDQVVCSNSPTVTLAGSFGGGASSASWSGGGGTFSDITSPTSTYSPS